MLYMQINTNSDGSMKGIQIRDKFQNYVFRWAAEDGLAELAFSLDEITEDNYLYVWDKKTAAPLIKMDPDLYISIIDLSKATERYKPKLFKHINDQMTQPHKFSRAKFISGFHNYYGFPEDFVEDEFL